MRVLVTGVAGFIGSHVAAHCLSLGWEVTGVDDLSGGFLENIPVGVDFRQGTVTDAEWVESLWKGARYDFVYHLSAYAAEGLSHFIRRYNYETNLIGSINLINQASAHEVKCFAFTSSIAVYGGKRGTMTEEDLPEPEDPYGISKYAVELDLAAANRMFGLPYIIFRPHNVYGERQNIADRYRNVIGIFMNQIVNGKPMTIFGDGTQTRAFSHIDDVAPIIARAPLVEGAYQQVFNIGSDCPSTVLSLAEKVARSLGVSPEMIFLSPRKEALHACPRHDKLRNTFGVSARVTLDEGLVSMARWVRKTGARKPVTFTRIEVSKGLPPSWIDRPGPGAAD